MFTVLVLEKGEGRRHITMAQLSQQGQPIPVTEMLRLGFSVELTSTRPECAEVIECEEGFMVDPLEVSNGPFALLTVLKNTQLDIVAAGGLACLVVPEDWRPIPDLIVVPAPEPGEPKEPSRIIQPN